MKGSSQMANSQQLTQEQLFAMNYQEQWNWMLTQPNFYLEDEDTMVCNGECEHLAWCFMCS
jgi:hypothetical protein